MARKSSKAEAPADTAAETGEAKVRREPPTTGWDKSLDGDHWSKTIACASPELAQELGRRLLKTAFKQNAQMTLTVGGPSIVVQLGATGKRFAGAGAKVARALRPVSVERYVNGEAAAKPDAA